MKKPRGLDPMHPGEKARLRATAVRARKLHPGPTGEILAEYVEAWEEFGYRFDSKGLMTRFMREIWGTKLPGEETIPEMDWTEV